MTTNVERQQQLRAQAIQRQQQQLQAQEQQQAAQAAQKKQYDMSGVSEQLAGMPPPPGMEGAYAKPTTAPAPKYDMSDATAALQAAGLTNIPVKTAAPAGQALRPYIYDGKVDLLGVVQSYDKPALNAAKYLFGQDVVAKAQHYAKIPVTQERWDTLTESTRANCRIVKGLPVELYNQLPDEAKPDYYIETTGVKANVAAGLGSGTLGRTAEYAPSVWESITPWKEEQGEKATTARVLAWEAELAIPFVHAARHWDEMGNLERALSLGLDLTIVGGLAAGSGRRVAAAAGRSLVTNAYGRRAARLITNELKGLEKALASGSETAIRQSGARIQALGQRLKATGLKGGPLVEQGAMIQAEASALANSSRTLKIKKAIRHILADQRGSVGLRYDIFPVSEREALESGLSWHELATIWRKTGNNSGRFRQAMRALKNEKAKKADTVKRDLERATERLQRKPEKTKPSVKVAERPQAKTWEETWQEILQGLNKPKERTKTLDDVLADLNRPSGKGKPKPSQATKKARREAKRAETDAERVAREIAKKRKDRAQWLKSGDKWKRDMEEVTRRQRLANRKVRATELDDAAVHEIQQRARKLRKLLKDQREGKATPGEIARAATEVARAKALRAATKALHKAATKAYKKAMAQGKTAAEIKAAVAAAVAKAAPSARAAAKAATATALAIAPATKLMPKAQQKKLVGTIVEVEVDVAKDREIAFSPLPSDKTPVPPGKPGPTEPPPTSPPPPGGPPPSTPPTPAPPPPGKPQQPRRRPRQVEENVEVKRVRDVPSNPGVVSFPMGIVRVRIKPPYRRGGQDVDYVRLKPPVEGKGSPERGVVVRRGDPPGELVLKQGMTNIRISDGKRISFSPNKNQRGPGILGADGKVRRQKRGSVLRG